MNEEQTNGTSAQPKNTTTTFRVERNKESLGLAEAATSVAVSTLMVAGMTAAFFGVRKLITGH